MLFRSTDANPWLRGRDLATTRPVTAGDHDGVPVEGWVTAYDGPNGRPLVVSVHGGPHYPAGWRFCFEAQRLAARGYAVLTANPAGAAATAGVSPPRSAAGGALPTGPAWNG